MTHEQRTQATSPYLTKEQVRQLWDAGSFLIQQYGLLFNCRITIFHDRIGLQQRSDQAAMISELIRRLGQRLKYWSPSKGEHFHWVYVHEKTLKGPSTTIIAYFPTDLEGDARHWLVKKFFAKQFRAIEPSAVRFSVLPKSTDPKLLLRRHLLLMRSICRSVDPSIRITNLGHRSRLAGILGLRRAFRQQFEKVSGRRFEISQRLNDEAQKHVAREGIGILSAFADGAFHYLLKGWEIKEHADRIREGARRSRELARFEVEYPSGTGKRSDQLRELALQELHKGWHIDPHLRLRSWSGWWVEKGDPRAFLD